MNSAIWILAGAIIGWAGYTALGFNATRGMMASIVIGAFGAVVGGTLVAPLLAALPAAGELNVPGFAFAVALAAAFLAIANFAHNRWGV